MIERDKCLPININVMIAAIHLTAFEKFSEDPLTTCPACGGAAGRVIGNVGDCVSKGSGWYINDSRPKASETTAAADPAKSGAEKTPESTAATTEPAAAKTEPAVDKKAKPAATPAAS